ncbi:MAG: hypothetical protein IPM16_19880 [Chloroflexi bacterium]|nr:hypothetical protein [Chloroflexota bacterium]
MLFLAISLGFLGIVSCYFNWIVGLLFVTASWVAWSAHKRTEQRAREDRQHQELIAAIREGKVTESDLQQPK